MITNDKILRKINENKQKPSESRKFQQVPPLW